MKYFVAIMMTAVFSLIWSQSLAMTCSALSSCEKAYEYLRQWYTNLDRDGDGIPCEALCKDSSTNSTPTIYYTPYVAPVATPTPAANTSTTWSSQTWWVYTGATSTWSISWQTLQQKIDRLVDTYVSTNASKTKQQHMVVVKVLHRLYLKQKTRSIKNLVWLYIITLTKRLDIDNPIQD